MAEINEIFSQEAIKTIHDATAAMEEYYLAQVKVGKVVEMSAAAIAKSGDTAAAKSSKIAAVKKEEAAAEAALDKQRQAAYKQMAKLEAKEREMADALAKEAKSIADLEKQNKALISARNKVDATTAAGVKQIDTYNKKIDENVEKIRVNVAAHEKQRMNIGNYKSALEGLPGAFGKAGAGVVGFSNTMKTAAAANPFMLILTIVLSLGMKLKELFGMTDAGALKFKQIFDQINAVFKILAERVRAFVTGISEFLSGNFREGIKSMGAAWAGVGDQIESATRAAKEYAAAMDQIEDFNISYISDLASINREIAEQRVLSKDRTKSDTERMAALQRALDLEKQIVELKKTQAAAIYEAEIKRVAGLVNKHEDYVRALIEVDAQTAQNLTNTIAYRDFWNNYQGDIQKLEEAYAAVMQTETDYFNETRKLQGELSGFKAEINEAAAKAAAERAAKEQEAYRKSNELARMTGQTAGEVEAERTEMTLENLQIRGDAEAEAHARVLAMIEIEKQERIAAAKEYAAAVEAIGQGLFQFNSQLQQAEAVRNENARQFELQMAGDNAAAKEKINAKYDKKERELKKKKAQMDKAFAIFDATIQMARAIVAATTAGPGIGIALAIITAAFNALQLAAIISTPIPAYAKGTRSARRGLAVVGEKGRELIMGPDGGLSLSPSTATLVNLGRGGHRIIPNQQTEALFRAARGGDDEHSRRLLQAVQAGDEKIVKAIQNKSELHISGDGRRITERKGNYYKNYIDKKIRL